MKYGPVFFTLVSIVYWIVGQIKYIFKASLRVIEETCLKEISQYSVLNNVTFKTSASPGARNFLLNCSWAVPTTSTSASCKHHPEKTALTWMLKLTHGCCWAGRSAYQSRTMSVMMFKPTWTVWELIRCGVPNQLTWTCSGNCQFYCTFLLENKGLPIHIYLSNTKKYLVGPEI